MTAADLNRIEQELNVKLPPAYRQVMQTGKFGAGHEGSQEFTGVAQEVIEMTKDFRRYRFFKAQWPDNFVAIGDNGAGDYYFTDITRTAPAVFKADHEMTAIKNRLVTNGCYETFADFMASIQKLHEETRNTIRRARTKRPRWNWWRIWKGIFR